MRLCVALCLCAEDKQPLTVRVAATIISACARPLFSLAAFAILAFTLTSQAQRGGTAQAPPADLVLTNGRIVTVDEGRPEAEAIAISKDRIQALGTAAEIKTMIGPNTQVIDLQGQLAIPGFIESHGHFTGVGGAQLQLNLMNVRVVGRDRARWSPRRRSRPSPASGSTAAAGTRRNGRRGRRRTSKASRRTRRSTRCRRTIPVLLVHASGHAAFANAQGDGAVRHPRGRPRARRAARSCSDANGDADRPAARDGAAA